MGGGGNSSPRRRLWRFQRRRFEAQRPLPYILDLGWGGEAAEEGPSGLAGSRRAWIACMKVAWCFLERERWECWCWCWWEKLWIFELGRDWWGVYICLGGWRGRQLSNTVHTRIGRARGNFCDVMARSRGLSFGTRKHAPFWLRKVTCEFVNMQSCSTYWQMILAMSHELKALSYFFFPSNCHIIF